MLLVRLRSSLVLSFVTGVLACSLPTAASASRHGAATGHAAGIRVSAYTSGAPRRAETNRSAPSSSRRVSRSRSRARTGRPSGVLPQPASLAPDGIQPATDRRPVTPANARAQTVHLATGILVRDERILLVASRYPNHAEPLWNVPGGRQKPGEFLAATVRREFHEEVGLEVEVGALRYVSESYDPTANVHFLSIAFEVRSSRRTSACRRGTRTRCVARGSTRTTSPRRSTLAVVREPLLAHLADRESTLLRIRRRGHHDLVRRRPVALDRVRGARDESPRRCRAVRESRARSHP